MDPSHAAPFSRPSSARTTRRGAVRLGVGAMSAAMAASRLRPAAAQEATPNPVTELVRATYGDPVETKLGIPYGKANGEDILLDVYLPPAADAPRPAVILIFGSGFVIGSRAGMAVLADHLAEAGYVAFAIDHRLVNDGADNAWPVQLDDVQRAVRWVRAHAAEYGVDPERIASLGWSSGALLASMLGLREARDNSDPELATYSSRVQCVVALAGDMDMTVPVTDYASKLVLADLFGGTVEEQPEAYRDASPLTWVDGEAASFFVAHGAIEDEILAEQSRQMVAALYDAKVESVYVTIPSVGHDGITDWNRIGPLVLAFLQTQLQSAW